MKKVLSLLMALIMAFSAVQCLSVVSFAADETFETEPNNDMNTATPISSFAKVYNGYLNAYDDQDWYTFTVEEADCFRVYFEMNENCDFTEINSGWNISIYQYGQSDPMKICKNNTGSIYESPILPYKGIFYVKIEAAFKSTSYAPIGCLYDLRVETTSGNSWEDESDDNANEAMDISSGEVFHGVLSNCTDQDWYKVIIPQDSDFFNVRFCYSDDADTTLINSGWNMSIYTDDLGEPLDTYKSISGETLTVHLPYKGTYYIKIEASSKSVSFAPIDCYYDINVITAFGDSWEDEPNDEPRLAKDISSQEVFTGSLINATDVDYYKFFVPDDTDYFKVAFCYNPYADTTLINSGWTLTIYDQDAVTVLWQEKNINGYTVTANLPYSGTMYARVEATSKSTSFAPIDCYYDINLITSLGNLWENEHNDEPSTATAIVPDVTYFGALQNKSDVDYYKFESTSDAFQFEFLIDESTDTSKIESGWNVAVYPYGSTTPIISYAKVQNDLLSYHIPYKGVFILKVYANSTSYAPVNCTYDIRIKQSGENEIWEREPGDTVSSAFSLVSGQTVNANLDRKDDIDYFKFTAPETGTISFDFNRDIDGDAKYGWKVSVVNVNNVVIGGNSFAFTDSENSCDAIRVTGGSTYYIKVAAKSTTSAPTWVNYQITLNFEKCAHSDYYSYPAKPATCTESGYEAYRVCKDCRTTITEYIEVPALGHSFTDYFVDDNATCTEDGTKTAKCDRCNVTDTIVDNGSAHGHIAAEAVKENEIAATCTEGGSYDSVVYCSVCRTELSRNKVNTDKLGHSFTDYVTDGNATCTADGTRTAYCDRCSATDTIADPGSAHGHIAASAVKENVVKATCKANGSYESVIYCKYCHEELSRTKATTDKIAHKIVTIKATPATCTKTGLTEGKKCSVCGEILTAQTVVSKKAHSYTTTTTKATTSKDGKIVTSCTACGKVAKTVVIAKASTAALSAVSYTYDGKVKTPSVTVKNSKGTALKNGTDYSVTYASGRKNPGQYAVKVTFKGNYSGSKMLYFTILPGVTSEIVTTTSASAVKLTWKAVPGATGYRVYVYNTSTKKYTALKTTTATSYTAAKLMSGTRYKFAVRAYTIVNGKVYWSAAYKTITATTNPGKPTLQVVPDKGKARLYCTEPHANGYEIYMKSGNTYKKIATLKTQYKDNGIQSSGVSTIPVNGVDVSFSANTKEYIKTGLTRGTTYSFKARAYKIVDGKVVYGDFSSVKSVKVK